MEKVNFNERYNSLIRTNKGGYKYSGFVMLPHSLLLDDRLTRTSLIIFWVLTMHMFRGKDYCFPSLPTIAKESRLDKRTVMRATKVLEKYGYLEIQREKGQVNKYYLKAII